MDAIDRRNLRYCEILTSIVQAQPSAAATIGFVMISVADCILRSKDGIRSDCSYSRGVWTGRVGQPVYERPERRLSRFITTLCGAT